MTTLAIVGSGILGQSLLYTLAKEKKSFEKITLLHSDEFAPACSKSSTAVVAPRGLTRGHSELGDILVDSYELFSNHVQQDSPGGVEVVPQFTTDEFKRNQFLKRYPHAVLSNDFLDIKFKETLYLAQDCAYLIWPETYLTWLRNESERLGNFKFEVINDFVIGLQAKDKILLTTQNGKELVFDKVIFTAGHYTRFFSDMGPELSRPKAVQGCYFQFDDLNYHLPSFSLSLNGDNLIWNKLHRKLLLGSTSQHVSHALPPLDQLSEIYSRVLEQLDFPLPQKQTAEIKTGIREKAQKRLPYLFCKGSVIFAGGLYKNGYSLSLKLARDLSRQYL